jgi:hypothetical protein
MSVPLRTFAKDPEAILNYTIDWSQWLGSDTIQTSTWPTITAGITMASSSNSTTTATIKVSGGTDGSDYDLTNRIVTAGGLTDERTIRIQVRQQ